MADYNSFFAVWTPRLLSVLRIVAAFLFIAHGTQKLFGFPAAPPPSPEERARQECVQKCAPPQQQQQGGRQPMMVVAGWLEFVGGLLLLLGLFTRPVAFILSGLMAVAYFMGHASGGFWPILNRGELAALYSFLFLFFSVSGGGEWALDRLFGRGRDAR